MDTLEFSSEFFSNNRARLRELFHGTAPIVLTAHGALQSSGDTSFRFVQDKSFWYLTGIDTPDVILVMDKDKEYLIMPEPHRSQEAVDGTVRNVALSEISGIKTIHTSKDGWKQLGSRLKKVKHMATLSAPPVYIDFFGFYTNPARAQLIQRVKEINEQIVVLDIRKHLARLRVVKQPIELQAIQKAIEITVETLKDITKPAKFKKYKFEYEVEADITQGFRKRGALGHAFDPIVSGGRNAAIFHNTANSDPIDQSQLLMIDTGAEVAHYAADISRTLAFQKPSRRQRNVYKAVFEAQEYSLSLLRPGVVIKDIEETMEHFIGEKLRELGLIKSISRETVRPFYPHLLSHYLGLDVHDAGDTTLPLEPGMVLVAEPGIYIKDENIGIRIEDDILITPGGNKVLSASLPRVLE